MTSTHSGALTDLGFSEEVYNLGPIDLGATRRTTVRLMYANSSSTDAVATWVAMYAPSEMEFGLDIEWRPNRRRGQDNRAALLQLAGRHGCLLIQLQRLRWMPNGLLTLLSDRKVKFSGVGIHKDCAKLTRDFGLQIHAQMIDLTSRAAEVFASGYFRQAGLATLCSQFWSDPLGKDKNVTLSDWEARNLSRDQVLYAATDAFMSYQLLVALKRRAPQRRRRMAH